MWLYTIFYNDKAHSVEKEPLPPQGAHHVPLPTPSQQHLRTILAYLDMPTLGQPEAFLQGKEGLFDAVGAIGAQSRPFLQGWMDRYVAWVTRLTAREPAIEPELGVEAVL